MVENITEEKILNEKLNETEEKFSLILENLPNGIIILSMKGNVLYINAAALKQLGVSEKEAYRRRYNDPAWNVYTLDGTPYYLAKLSFFASMRKRRPIKNLELMCRRKDGTDIVLSSNITTISSKGQTIPNILISLTDITQIKKAVQKAVELNFQLEKMSSLDGLTGIDNRRSFDEHMEIEWKRCLRESKSLSLIMIDIDHFKLFNDTYGHQGGDNCLKEVAETLGCLIKRPPDIVCRYGGEEFVIKLPETDEEGARVVAERLRNGIQDLRILHAGSRVSKFVTISLGVASIIPNKYISANELIERADKALYKAKLDGRNRYSVYTSNY
jgi:diguanylate cyclase (GGDEF)-like protein/PAS domain S-box-containing protein